MGAGIGVYPNGWDSPEVQQACGYTSKAFNMGEFFCLLQLVHVLPKQVYMHSHERSLDM